MIANPLERFHVVLRNRVEMAARWHGLRNLDAVCDFVMRDPDIAALWRQRPVQKQIIMESIAIVLDYAATDLDGCREKFGHEFVDLIVASRDRLLTRSHGGADGPAA